MTVSSPVPWLTKAGKFEVEHIGGIPHFSEPVLLDKPRAGVLHTTEGGWTGAMAIFKQRYAPQFMVGWDDVQKRTRIVQMVQVGTIGAALKTHNNLAIVQVELADNPLGQDRSKEQLWMPDPATAEALAALMAACELEYGIPLTHPWPDGIYGKATALDPHRNHGEFGTIAGWYGHGDVPAPDFHWDPGALKWSELFEMAKAVEVGAPTPPIAADLQHPCETSALDADLVTAAIQANAATKAAILKGLAG